MSTTRLVAVLVFHVLAWLPARLFHWCRRLPLKAVAALCVPIISGLVVAYVAGTGRFGQPIAQQSGTQTTAATPTESASFVAVVYGPADGALKHVATGVPSAYAGVKLRNFMVDVRFYNPYDRSEARWDYGIGFRHSGVGDQYRMIVDSDGDWQLFLLRRADDSTVFDRIAGARLVNVDVSPTGSNHLRLLVKADTAVFFVNNRLITAVDVSKRDVAGDVWLGTGFQSKYSIADRTTHYEGFTVWSLP